MDILKHLTNCKVHSTVSQEEDESTWVALRKKGIGGSDIGTLCGENQYSSARALYFKKTGQYEDGVEEEVFTADAVERMKFGHLLEPVVADEYAKRTGRKVVVSPATLSHKDYPWALANVDRIIVDDDGKPYGILECKTANSRLADIWEAGELPISYLYQLQWYLFVTGLKFGSMACLVGGNKYFYYEVFRDDELIKTLVEKADKFWNYHVKELVVPELNGTDADTELINKQHANVVAKAEIVMQDDIHNELAQTVQTAKARIKELTKIKDEAQNRLKDVMKTNEIGFTTDFVIKWSGRCQTRVDMDTLKTDYPDVYEKCLKTIEFRVMTIKGGS